MKRSTLWPTREEIQESIKPAAQILGWSAEKFRNAATSEILHMINTPPERRTIPLIVHLLDSVNYPNQTSESTHEIH
jgi:hypothetical protein